MTYYTPEMPVQFRDRDRIRNARFVRYIPNTQAVVLYVTDSDWPGNRESKIALRNLLP